MDEMNRGLDRPRSVLYNMAPDGRVMEFGFTGKKLERNQRTFSICSFAFSNSSFISTTQRWIFTS